MITLVAATPYDAVPAVPPWDEATMAQNIGGDSRRAICFYNTAGGGTCDGTYSIWGRKGTDEWVRIGAPIVIAGSTQGHAIPDMEEINTFNKIHVSADGGAAANRWFLASGGNQGYE
jgi:hypothetical protein